MPRRHVRAYAEPVTSERGRTVVVSGDVTVDWNLARLAPPGVAGGWHPDLKARASRQRGGAALLSDLVEGALARRPSDAPEPVLLGVDLAADRMTPDEPRFSHSYAVWGPCEVTRGAEPRVWRVDPPMGLDRARSEDWLREEWQRLGGDLPRADVIALDDAALGFREQSDPGLWRSVAEGGRNPWVLLKASRPVADGPLWDHLREHCSERLVALMTIDDLRGTAVKVSRELSWERTAQDLYWELVHNPLVNSLSLCAHVVVSFGAAGAALLSRSAGDNGTGPTRCSLLFDPEVIEGMWEAERPGAMIGTTACLAASLVRELTLAEEEPDLARATGAGVAAGRRLWDEGYGEADHGMDVAFPLPAVLDELVATGGLLERVEVQDPAAFLPQPQGGSDPTAGTAVPTVAGHWTILEDRYSGDLREVAADVALRGPEVALEGVPFGRFGKLLTVDRGEIESFRAVRGLIAEYCSSSWQTPLSVGVFGAPGSGKSFVMVQMAASVAPGLISDKIEFNLSQFGSLKDLHDALHQVRDVALTGAIPLVCWDEFDTAFQGEELGWLRYFLAPMEDGAFREGQVSHPIGRAIFVFAGGTSHRMDRFGAGISPEAFRNLKGPDFVSRLKGYVNVLGVNPREDERDPHHVIRRAMWLRAILERDAPGLFDADGVLRIDPGVLHAFLEVEEYGHGGRSLESVVATSRLAGETSYQRSSLPAEAQLDLHVNGREFLAVVQRMDLEGEPLERLAEAMHEIFCEDLRARGRDSAALVPWQDLPEELKRQNRGAVRDIPEKLRRIGHVMIPARSHDAPFDFPGEDLEELAEYEHRRFVQAKVAEGWTVGERSDERRTNPTLVPWEDLPEDEREKDRAQVRGIPRVLARAGYTVVRSTRENGGGSS